MRQPFFKKTHQSWYVELNGKQVNLGKDKDEAFKEYHRLMAADTPVTSRTPVVNLLDQFLAWTKDNREKRTFDWYADHLQKFATHIGARLTVPDLKPIHVTRWLTSCKTSGNNTRNGAARAVNRAFNWAKKQGLIPANPVSGMERPAYEPRECYLTPEQWTAAIALVAETDPFHDLLTFMRETGCRPAEARLVSAKHWDRANARLVLERKNTKGKKSRRVIRLNDKAQAVVTRLALKNPEGALFLNRRKRAWTAYSVNCRYSKMKKKLNFEWFPYILRHTWITDALLRGVDPLTVAIFVGHKDASMVMKVYNHLVQNDDFLRQKLRQATGEEDVA